MRGSNPSVCRWVEEAGQRGGLVTLPSYLCHGNSLTRALDGLLEMLGDRVLLFDTDAARHATIPSSLSQRETPVGFPTPDGYIAAIAATAFR
jgi:predicted nucleic acid-binding protein